MGPECSCSWGQFSLHENDFPSTYCPFYFSVLATTGPDQKKLSGGGGDWSEPVRYSTAPPLSPPTHKSLIKTEPRGHLGNNFFYVHFVTLNQHKIAILPILSSCIKVVRHECCIYKIRSTIFRKKYLNVNNKSLTTIINA